jgi:hypothetical protein
MPIEGKGSASVKFLWVNGSEWVKGWKCYSPDESMESSSLSPPSVRSGKTKEEIKIDCTSLQPSWSWSESYRWGPIAWSSPFTKDKENHYPLTWTHPDFHKGEREEERQKLSVLHISALANYKLMWKETLLHLKVESGKDNYNDRWTFFINDNEYFSQLCSEYWLHHCRLPVNLWLLGPFLSVVGCDRIFMGGTIYISPQICPWPWANHAERRCSSHPDFSLTKWTSDFFKCKKSRDYFLHKQVTLLNGLCHWLNE